MRHAKRDQRTLQYGAFGLGAFLLGITPLGEAVRTHKSEDDGEITPAWGVPRPFRACVQTASDKVSAAQYGDRVAAVQKLYGATADLCVGTGIWLDAPITGDPDYTVISAPRLPQERIYDIGKRGVFGG